MRVNAAGSRRRAPMRAAAGSPTLGTPPPPPPKPSTKPPDAPRSAGEAIPRVGHRPERRLVRGSVELSTENLPLENATQGAAECHRCNYDRDVPNSHKRATRTPRCTG